MTHNTGLWFKRGSTGKMVQWQGWVHGDTFYVRSGQFCGKLTTTAGVQCSGKQGRSDYEQACFQLNAKLNKKKDAGYLDDYDAALTHVVMLPMLAHSFAKRSHDIVFPCIVQPKFDGVRCFAMPDGGLLSRTGKEFPHLNHVRQDGSENVVLDGELYSDVLTFQEVVGLVKRVDLKAGDDERMLLIKLRVYDCYIPTAPDADFSVRMGWVSSVCERHLHHINTENTLAHNEDDIYRLQQQFVEEGYEGAMVRNLDGAYALAKRSANLQKVKSFEDAEYRIVGYEQAEGSDIGTVIWKCVTPAGQEFMTRPTGTREQRRAWFEAGQQYIGKMLTVKYQELTDDGIPRFPVGIAVRDYE